MSKFMLMMEVKLSLVIVTCRRTADLLTRPLVFLSPYMTQWASLEMKAAWHGQSTKLVILDWLPVQPSKCFGFFFPLSSACFLLAVRKSCEQKSWSWLHQAFRSVVFVRHLMAFFRKVFFLWYWGRNVAAPKSASLLNGRFSYFTKVLPKIAACSWCLA